jgi:ribosome-associated protein
MRRDLPEDEDPYDGPSKSARKREAHALQELGEELIEAPDSLLDELPLPEALRDAIVQARRITSRGAMVRQRQYIGKLMRHADAGAIREALEARAEAQRLEARRHQRIEDWRDRLLSDDAAALDAFMDENPGADRAALARLIAKAGRERAVGAPPAAARSLFRALREALAPAPPAPGA